MAYLSEPSGKTLSEIAVEFLKLNPRGASLWHGLNVFGVWLTTAHHMALCCRVDPKPGHLWAGSSLVAKIKRPAARGYNPLKGDT